MNHLDFSRLRSTSRKFPHYVMVTSSVTLLRVPSLLWYLQFNFLAFDTHFCVGSALCLYVHYLSVAVGVGGSTLPELPWQPETHFSNLVFGYCYFTNPLYKKAPHVRVNLV